MLFCAAALPGRLHRIRQIEAARHDLEGSRQKFERLEFVVFIVGRVEFVVLQNPTCSPRRKVIIPSLISSLDGRIAQIAEGRLRQFSLMLRPSFILVK